MILATILALLLAGPSAASSASATAGWPMANPTWPAGLPMPLVEGIAYAPGDIVLESQFAGGIKSRRRASWAPELVRFRLAVTRAQLQTVVDFESITCQSVLPFDWIEFRDPASAVATYTWANPRPAQTARRTERMWTVDINLRLMTRFNGTFDLGDGGGFALLTDDDEIITT